MSCFISDAMGHVCITRERVPAISIQHARVACMYSSNRGRNMALALVCADVLIQDGLLSKVLPALRAFIWLLTGVNPEVLVEDGALPERALAINTSVRLLVRVDAQVLRQVALLPEALAALRAAVRPAVRVDALMLQQRRFLLEVLAARQALEQAQLCACKSNQSTHIITI